MKALLQDDNYRIPHKDGTGFLTHIDISEEKRQAVIRGDKEATQEIAAEYNMDMDSLLMEARKERERLEEEKERVTRAEGGDVDEQMTMLMGPTHTMPDGTVMPGATHEEGEMMMEESEMESDSEMEDNYLDFIINEALSEEEEDMLMSKLEQDEELSMLFDKVIEVASEFAGSGPVEGPGTGVSDSIPARLSDGEFVFTAKAVKEIGADELMRMMKDAEMQKLFIKWDSIIDNHWIEFLFPMPMQ